ncbi:hypothetical protein RND71_021884 [Anisodus tanguticus]|uniref:Uncharacterized protein n=1 Tax=Anisodus tanguticus TaxID=243964 RepID=A0AAE1RXV3_9SOLA|nr:hypothetical protein RND71_021884 [Anisodus tanguticus]
MFLIFHVKQEAATLAAAEVAFLLQAGQQSGLHIRIAPRPAPAAEPSTSTDQATIHVSTPPRQVEPPRPEMGEEEK